MPVTKYLWDENSYLEENDEFGLVTAAYTCEPTEFGSVVSQNRGSQTSFYNYDTQGSTHQLTDQSENITDTFLFDSWGNEITRTGTTTTPFQYVGELGYYYDEETDNYYIRARTYQPSIGRWLSYDPLRFVSGLNLFCYVNNQVTKLRDPSGLKIKFVGTPGPVRLATRLYEKLLKDANDDLKKILNQVEADNFSCIIKVRSHDKTVGIGVFEDNEIDIADINKFPDKSHGSTKFSVLTHEIIEQWLKQKHDKKVFLTAHAEAIKYENLASGNTRLTISPKPIIHRDGSRTYVIKFLSKVDIIRDGKKVTITKSFIETIKMKAKEVLEVKVEPE